MPNGIRIRSAVFPQCTGQTDAPTHRPTDRPRKSLIAIGRCATRATRRNNNCQNVKIYEYKIVGAISENGARQYDGMWRKQFTVLLSELELRRWFKGTSRRNSATMMDLWLTGAYSTAVGYNLRSSSLELVSRRDQTSPVGAIIGQSMSSNLPTTRGARWPRWFFQRKLISGLITRWRTSDGPITAVLSVTVEADTGPNFLTRPNTISNGTNQTEPNRKQILYWSVFTIKVTTKIIITVQKNRTT